MVPDDDADEVTQDVFVRAWQKLGSFRGESAFGTWLHRLAVNVMLAHRPSLGQAGERWTSDEAAEGLRPAARRPMTAMDFEQALARLPDGMRQIFVLYDVEGYRHEEIAGCWALHRHLEVTAAPGPDGAAPTTWTGEDT